MLKIIGEEGVSALWSGTKADKFTSTFGGKKETI